MREKHREQTLRDLHRAALDLVQRDGLAETPVTAIAERAGVSRRTFFNYYASKEDAVLGLTPPTIPTETLDSFLDLPAGQQRFKEILRLSVATLATSPPGDSRSEIKDLLIAYPELAARLRRHHIDLADLLTEAITDRLAASGYPVSSSDSARAVITLAFAVLSFAGSRDPAGLNTSDPEAIDTALTIFKNALKEI